MRSEKKEGRKVQKGNRKRKQWQKGEAALCPILSASLATHAKIKPVNKHGSPCFVPNDSDLRLFVFPPDFCIRGKNILHDGTIYKIQVE